MSRANLFDCYFLLLKFIATLFNIVNFAVNFCLHFDHWMTHTSPVIPSSRKVLHIPEASPKLHLVLGLKFAPCVQRMVWFFCIIEKMTKWATLCSVNCQATHTHTHTHTLAYPQKQIVVCVNIGTLKSDCIVLTFKYAGKHMSKNTKKRSCRREGSICNILIC